MVDTRTVLELRELIFVLIHVEICGRFLSAAPDRRTIICLSSLELCIVETKIDLFVLTFNAALPLPSLLASRDPTKLARPFRTDVASPSEI